MIVSVTEAEKLIRNGEAVLVDVREPDEFKAEHIAYAMSVPLGSLEDGFQTLNIPENKTILFQCLKGSRGQMACNRIQNLGTCKNTIANIEGGIEAWRKQGLPVITSGTSNQTVSIFRQVQIIIGFLIAFCVMIGFTVNNIGFGLAGILGLALFFAGVTGWCGLAMLLSKMPWNT